ncbi:MAG TPA: glycosyltransferase [Aeromicrobium sp.]|nr:glycosyltransferase [Aeromicrobium sp.]
MRIVIDLQGAQSESRYHGIGRYSQELAVGVASHPRQHDVWLLFNGSFREAARDLRARFAGLVPPERMVTFFPPSPIETQVAEPRPRRRVAEELRAEVLAALEPDCILVTSLIDPLGSDAATTNTRPEFDAVTAAVVYDLIPWIQPERYLAEPTTRAYYESKLIELGRVGLVLAISESSRRESLEHLPLPSERVVTILSAAGEEFSPGEPDRQVDLERVGITGPFVLYAPSGYDVRKNIEGLITAYARMPEDVRASRQLVITSRFKQSEHDRLRAIAAKEGMGATELVLTGYVPDADLIELYRSTELFVYPSLHEGFGLPALEAMSCGAPVIGSDRTSVPEVIGNQSALFDASSITEMSERMSDTLRSPDRRAELREHGLTQAKEFSWSRTVERTLDAIEQTFTETTPPIAEAPPQARQRLAFVSPLPPAQSGIAGYSADLLPALTEYFDVTLICEQAGATLAPPLDALPLRSATWLESHGSEFDHVLYQLGNSDLHTFMLPLLRTQPGFVVLHDFYLSGLYWMAQGTERLPAVWDRAVVNSHGDVARRVTSSIDIQAAYPFNREVLNAARGVIVHSCRAQELVDGWYGPIAQPRVTVIPLTRSHPDELGRQKSRQQLGIADDAFLICSFGRLHEVKRDRELLRAWLSSASAQDSRCVLHFVGASSDPAFAEELRKEADKHPAGSRVTLTGWLSDSDYTAYLESADVAVQLRASSRGETSAAVLDCLNYGVATIVNAHGSTAELPADAVRFLADEFTEAELAAAIDELHGDGELRAAVGRRGRDMIERKHRPEQCAASYADVIQSSSDDPRTAHVRLLKRLLTLVPENRAELLPDVAQAVARTFPPPVTARQILIDITHTPGWPRRAEADRLVLDAPSDLRVVFASVLASARGASLVRADGHPREADPAVLLADLHPGDILVVPDAETIRESAVREAYVAAQAVGVRIAAFLESPEPLVDLVDLLLASDCGIYCVDTSLGELAERAAKRTNVPVRVLVNPSGDPRSALVRALIEDVRPCG